MEIKIKKNLLSNLLDKAQNIVEKKNTMPILVNALLESKENKLYLFATDLEVSLMDSVDCEVKKSGKVAVGAQFRAAGAFSEGLALVAVPVKKSSMN